MWRIAIIDDDRQVLQGMKLSIPWEELNAEWAGEALNGSDGLAMIRQTQPDVVITDIYMPGMNGLEMIEQLREQEYGGKIIILSGYSDFEYARQALRLHVSDYLSKPISMPTLKSILEKALRDLEEEEERRVKQDELEQKLMMYEPFVEKEWVKSAVAGTLADSYRTGNLLPAPYRYWSETHHVVMGIDIVRDVRVSQLSLSDWNLFRFAVSNIVNEVAHEAFAFVDYTELHSTRTALVIHLQPDLSERQLQEQLIQLGVRLIDCIRSYLKLVIRIGIGRVQEEWKDIPDSTEEAFRAVEMKENRAAEGYDLFASGSEARIGQGNGVLRPVKFYLELAAAIKTSQEWQAERIISEFIERLEKQEGITPDYLQMLAGELWGIFAYCLYEVGMVLDDLYPNEHITKEIAGLAQPKQLEVWLTDKIAAISSSRQWRGNSKHRQAVDFMIQYIHDHFAKDITLGDLADKVYISRNYLSIIFKNMTGESFNNYLTRVRIEKAKELLLEKRMLVYEVAEKVGYKNVPYFSTLFKKFTGINPTDVIK
ncbi:response regulator transcription factor [Paenibacillus rigui]|uniref:DNA-binding response regulator n=1 Tax=Paenibacillus rigui TaxID=554312 RepID=A0A229USQ8_9BACL|nr:response regulator transcription factor [Paenibacillus rigui]OXM86291.1 DNA-binding response regulator [Paenibacillus rigui]